MSVKVKICGLKTEDAVASAVLSGADYLGFVFFANSPRNVTVEQAKNLMKIIPDDIKVVAVTVDAKNEDLDIIFANFKPDYIQCHGSESVERLIELKERYGFAIIKAIAVSSQDDIVKGMEYENIADMLLFDSKDPESILPGGNGLSFDWTLLKSLSFTKNWFLSGGLTIQNINDAISITGARQVDVSSSIESKPGIKDPDLIRKFLNKVKNNE
jgi:phosphoribosylanthranilate isomerase